jgi:hypothetical protein
LSWCDKLASVPTVGFTIDWHFAAGNALWGAMSPVLDKLVSNDKPTFTVNQNEPFAISFVTEDGFQYAVDSSRVVVSFQHRLRAKPVSGGPPVMEMLSRPLPFSELLPDVCERLVETALVIPGARNRKVTRVGIVALTMLDVSEAPPGIGRFIDYLSRPWGRSVDTFSFQIVGELGRASGWTDRCIHNLIKPEGPESLLTLTFDWQRTFTSGQSINPDSLKGILARAQTDAEIYFEDLAEGSRFDEDILRPTA